MSRSCQRVGNGFVRLIVMVLLLGAEAAAVHAQTAALSGMVTDVSGGTLPGVSVTLVSEAGTPSRAVTTDGAGRFAFHGLAPGAYRLRAELVGFRSDEQSIALSGSSISLDLTLVLAGFAEQVSVTASRDERVLGAEPAAVGVAGGEPVLDGRSLRALFMTVWRSSTRSAENSCGIRQS